MTVALLSEALDQVETELNDRKVVLSPEARETINRTYGFGGVKYGEVVKCDVEIESLKGKNTRKWFHIVIERFDHNGRYEVVTYVL